MESIFHYSGQPQIVTSSYKYAAPKKDEKVIIIIIYFIYESKA